MNTKDIILDFQKIPWKSANMAEWGDDLLCTIWESQKHLIRKYHDIERRNGCVVIPEVNWGDLDDRYVQMRLKDLMQRCVEELGEAMNCLKNKPWKNSYVETDKPHFEEELADALHFFVELCLTAGVSAEDLFTLYMKKHAVNEFRQDSNY